MSQDVFAVEAEESALPVGVEIDDLLRRAVAAGASDLHITAGAPPMVRVNGVLQPLDGLAAPLTPVETQVLVGHVVGGRHRERLESQGQADLSYGVAGLGRFRVNAFLQRGSYGTALRIIPTEAPSAEALGLPPIMKRLARLNRGLILMTGPTGSGKSTTLACLVDLINTERACHIVTLEDPIEYLHRHKRSIVNQREIGHDTSGFAEGLRAALRQDPDVILVGEMRDLETIATAITAAETGHLVMATLHTTDAVGAIDRVVDVFPPHQQQQVRVQLAATLQAVLAQQLVPRADGSGRILAAEVLVATTAVRNLIREGKTHQILSLQQTGAQYGMQTFEGVFAHLIQNGVVRAEDARDYLAAVGPDLHGQRLGDGNAAFRVQRQR